ncbi:hypothetical protein GGR54DRAFT_240192 [Hypoxylon sp. NC1633]|nr:hypothetical protein GGR54DRAFT_240192 [Hypoxylon sp. NC1633]
MDITRKDDPKDGLISIRVEDHHHQVNRDSSASSAEISSRNATECISSCYHQFVDGWSERIHGGFEDVCYQLSHVQPNTELWRLYCCDSVSCGVFINKAGQSPSVDLIINTCQGIGNFPIFDPGPPLSTVFSCPSVVEESRPGETGLVASPSSTGQSAMITTTSTPSYSAAKSTPSSELNATASGVDVAPSASTGLTEGSKAAIGICSSLAIIAVIFLVGFLISRRRSRPKGYLNNAANAPVLRRSSSEPPSGSHSPLITPPPSASSKGPPRTPPARLSERRFLPSLLKQGGGATPNSSLASGMDERGFPSAALGAPSEKKNLAQHHERRATSNSNSINQPPLPPSPPAAVHFAPYFLRDSGSSYSSGPGGASTATTGSNKASSVHSVAAAVHGTHTPPSTLPLSPTRPARPHEGPLEIPNLVTPAGPPPNRALPAPPPYHPSSPTFSVSPVSPTGSAIGVALPASAKDLHEASESWGSWSGGGGIVGGKRRGHGGHGRSRDHAAGGGGAGDGSKKGGSGSLVSLQELDLEKLGGRY